MIDFNKVIRLGAIIISSCFLSRFGSQDKVTGMEKEHLIAP